MIALLDLGLLVLDPEAWNPDRERCLAAMAGMAIHNRWLRRFPVRVLWNDAFFLGFPSNQAGCPRDLREAWVAVISLHDYLRGNGLLLSPDALPACPKAAPVIEPDLLAEDHGYPDDLRDVWRALLGSALTARPLLDGGFCVPTWDRPLLAAERALRITNAPELPALVDTAPLVIADVDWRGFLDRYHRPDLRGRRVAVLGGNRAAFERARERLATYGLEDLRRLPPAYEESRTKQETRQRLDRVELLIVCTNRLKHTDTDQLKGALPEPPCARVDLNNDTDAQIVKAVVDHFRPLPEGAGA